MESGMSRGILREFVQDGEEKQFSDEFVSEDRGANIECF